MPTKAQISSVVTAIRHSENDENDKAKKALDKSLNGVDVEEAFNGCGALVSMFHTQLKEKKAKSAIARTRNRLSNSIATIAPDGISGKKSGPAKKAKSTPKAENDCLCGCGEKVRGTFKQGHDQRVKGYLKKAMDENQNLFMTEIPEEAQEVGLDKKKVRELADRWEFGVNQIRN
jgi:hypothetical protein